MRRRSEAPVEFTRACTVWPFVRFLNDIGAPTEQLLGEARIAPDLLEHAEALVPLPLAYRFLELAARREGGMAIGMAVAQRTSVFDLGTFGATLRRASTIGDYVSAAISGINASTSGERFWLQDEGTGLRIGQFLPGPAGTGRTIADAYTLALTVHMLRRSLGDDWCPDEVTLLAGGDRMPGDDVLLGDARVITGHRCSSVMIERALLEQPLAGSGAVPPGLPGATSAGVAPMPGSFIDRLEALIRALLPGGHPDIRYVADLAGMSPRTLQRRLAEDGLTYSATVLRCRMSLAMAWLARSDARIIDIAQQLGYRDAGNFSRAFRTQVGVSPLAFRSAGAARGE